MSTGEKRWDVEGVTALLDSAAASLADLTPGSLCRIGGKDLLGVAARLEQVSRLVFAAQLVVVDEVHAQGVAQMMGAPSTAVLLSDQLLISRGQARQRLAAAMATLSQDSMTGGELDPVLPALASAVQQGWVNPDQVRSVVETMAELKDLDPETFVVTEKVLVETATQVPPAPFAKFCAQVADQLDQDGELPADEARENMSLTFGQRNLRTGLTTVTGKLDDITMEMLDKALDGLAAPRPSNECGPDLRPGPLRLAQAFSEMLRRYLNLGDAPTDHGVRPHITVTVTLEGLEAAFQEAVATGAVFDTGAPVTPAMLRQLLCDAKITPVVLGGNGEILDVGREQRTFTGAIRRALVARDRGCAFPGCTCPASWCDGHHVAEWAAMNGVTSVDNGVLLCGFHHTEIHRGNWKVRIRNGIPEFLPPLWIDPEQRWRRNLLHHLDPPPEIRPPSQGSEPHTG